jgi:hypothetical protein
MPSRKRQQEMTERRVVLIAAIVGLLAAVFGVAQQVWPTTQHPTPQPTVVVIVEKPSRAPGQVAGPCPPAASSDSYDPKPFPPE